PARSRSLRFGSNLRITSCRQCRRRSESREPVLNQTQKPPKRKIQLDCGKYFLRTLQREDATDQWASWMAEPKNLRLLNSAPKVMTRADIEMYIDQFDQRSHLLI